MTTFLERVCGALDKHKVPYALVGGYAVALHGAIRGTVDVDFVTKFKRDCFVGVEKALQELGLQSRIPVTADDVFHFREEYIKRRNLVAWSFYNPQNPLEIVDLIITNDLAKMKSVKKSLNRKSISIVSVPDLIKMKKQSARPQDLADVELLEKL